VVEVFISVYAKPPLPDLTHPRLRLIILFISKYLVSTRVSVFVQKLPEVNMAVLFLVFVCKLLCKVYDSTPKNQAPDSGSYILRLKRNSKCCWKSVLVGWEVWMLRCMVPGSFQYNFIKLTVLFKRIEDGHWGTCYFFDILLSVFQCFSKHCFKLIIYDILFPDGAHSSTVESLCYKSEGHGFESQWGHWMFSVYLIYQPC
jgi:hypothetical protein